MPPCEADHFGKPVFAGFSSDTARCPGITGSLPVLSSTVVVIVATGVAVWYLVGAGENIWQEGTIYLEPAEEWRIFSLLQCGWK